VKGVTKIGFMPSSLFRELFHFVSVQCTELYRYPIRIDSDQVEGDPLWSGSSSGYRTGLFMQSRL